jgi:agmatine/peptidylarginine deiminase
MTKWLINLEDKTMLQKVACLMNENKKPKYNPEYEATLSEKEKIAYWQKVGITGDEFFNDVIAHIKTLPWKK